jgi:hypothetical protein
MPVVVLRSRGQQMLRRVARISFFGDGLLERARTMYLALLGAVAATGLAIVAFALQLGWPIGADRPLPSTPPKRQAVGAGVALAAAPPRPASARRESGRRDGAPRAATPAVAATGQDSGPTSSPVVAGSEPTPPPDRHPPGHQEAPQGQPAPPAQAPSPTQPPPAPQGPQGGSGASKPGPPADPEPAPAPQPEPPPEPEAEASSVPGNGNAYGKGNGNGPPAPPPAVGNPHAWDGAPSHGHGASFHGDAGDRHCRDD